MKAILLEDIIRAVNGVINKNINTDDIYIDNVVIDSREISNANSRDLFIPIKGDNFDGHDFIENVFKMGAICSLSEKDISTDGIVIKVGNTRQALKDLSRFYLNLFDVKVVALTGSVGKTTTKDMIASCLSEKYNVTKTKGNFNNEIGLPLTIFNVEDNTEVVVLEMGMSNSGEIRELSKIANPDIALITNVGVAHVENFNNGQEGIFRAKYEIFDYLKEDGIKILNYDSEFLCDLQFNKNDGISKEQYFYSLENINIVQVYPIKITHKNISHTEVEVSCFGEIFKIDLNCSGNHMVSNALASILVSCKLGLSKEQIQDGLKNFKPSGMRMDIVNAEKYTLINDVYNANPTSMKASIDVLSTCSGRRVAILGDMFELGDILTNSLHLEVGEYTKQNNINVVICIGIHSEYMFKGATCDIDNSTNAYYFETKEKFLSSGMSLIETGDTILVKASRGMHFEAIVEEIIKEIV